MTGLKLEDPTVDVGDIEKYRLAFLMQFFVQHRSRFRFPRLRLQDLYQRVIKDPEPTAFCDLVARILRFLNHGDPDICIDHVDQALDRFTVDKRTSYRIQMQRHRNGKPVHQLTAEARAALLENLIESVYDEQPDFNFTSTTGFNATATGANSGLTNGCRPATNNGSGADGSMSDADGSGNLFGGPGNLAGFPDEGQPGDFGESDDENVLIIKAGQDAQGCSYYYMEDLRLYRERPQSGISSQWDVAVGPTANQWQAFIASLSRNEKEYDLYYFLQHDLFELVKESLVRYDLQEVNDKLDTAYLRAKEASELAELRRLKVGTMGSTQVSGPNADDDDVKFPIIGLGTNGPKSASPAFSGGHGGVGSAGSSTSGAPLTPSSSARTPTSAPPATTVLLSNGYLPPSAPAAPAASSTPDLMDAHGLGKSEANVFTTRPNLNNSQPSWSACDSTSGTAQPGKTRSYSGQPNGETISGMKLADGPGNNTSSPSLDPDTSALIASAAESIQSAVQTKSSPSPALDPDTAALISSDSVGLEPSHIERELAAAMKESHAKSSPTSGTDSSGNTAAWNSSGNRGPMGQSQRPDSRCLPASRGLNGLSVEQSPFGTCPPSGAPNSLTDVADPTSVTRSSSSSQLVPPTTASSSTPGTLSTSTPNTKPSTYAFDPATRTKEMPPTGLVDPASLRPNMVAVRPQGPVDHTQQPSAPPQPGDNHFPSGAVDCAGFGLGPISKSHINPATALVSPMVGIPDTTLTQEQWENRKTKIAKLEKIQSTLNRSKSASTPGAVAAAAGAVLQQQRFQGGAGAAAVAPPPTSLAPSPGSIPSHVVGVNAPVGFGSPPYVGSQRPGLVDPYGGSRPVMMPGAPPSEMAQREWDRLCLDYQREKGEPPGPRFHPSCRQAMMYDPNGCPLMSTDPSTPPHGSLPPNTMMMMPSQVMMDHTVSCGPNMRHFGPQMDGPGLGPPVVMVPPNNTNLTSTNSGYPPPPSASGPMSGIPQGQHFRPMPASMGGYVCTDQSVQMGMVPQTGYKRAYHGVPIATNDPWVGPGATHPMLSQVSMNEAAMFPTGPMPPGQRIGQMTGSGMGSPPPMGGPGIPVSISPSNVVTTVGSVTTNSSTTSGGRTSSGMGKAGGKKRKTTAAANRAAAAAAAASSNLNATNNASPATTAASGVSQPVTPYGKQPGLSGSMTPNKPSYLMPPYMVDNSGLVGLPPHSHRPPVYMSQTAAANHPQQQSPGPLSHYPGGVTDPYFAHYPEMAGAAQSVGRPIGHTPPSGLEGRRALTPKGTDVFAMGGGPNSGGGGGGGMTGGRMPPSNCQVGFSTGPGGCPNSSMIHPYLQSPDGSIQTSGDPATGVRSTGSYTTQHLTSASLASLARLSQMSGPEGPPYAPGSSSASSNAGAGGSQLPAPPTASGTAAYSSRGNPMLAYQQQQQQADGSNSCLPPLPQPQLMRSHSISSGLKSHLSHEQPDQSSSMSVNPSVVPPQSNPGMQPKFGAQGYHSQQSLPAGMLSTQSTTPMQQPQPPSIQVNNTFFNAQLNVQQMNYQHVSAPGSTGQMQIHFVQQQQQNQQPQQPVPPSHDQSSGTSVHRTSRALDPNSRLSSACTTAAAASTTTATTTMSSTTTSNTGPDYYHQPDSSMMQHRFQSNYPNELSVKSGDQLSCPSLPTSNSGGPPVSGYGNTSIQITPKTPHTIQYLPNPMAQNQAADNNSTQYAAASASSTRAPGRMNNSNSNIQTSSTPSYHSDPDADSTGASARQAVPSVAAAANSMSFHSGHMYATHHPSPQSQQQQQQQYSQPGANLPPPTYHQTQPTGSMKMVSSQQQQQHPSNRAPLPNGPWSTTIDSPPFDPNHPGSIPVSFCSGMEPTTYSVPGGRAPGGLSHPSMKMMNVSAPGSYPPGSLSFHNDPMVEHMPPAFLSEPMSMNRGSSAGGSGHSAQYGRSQSSGRHPVYDQAPPQQQQHVYRQQQQYSHTQSSQQQQQHQMFMSSSNYVSEGPTGPGGQVQFVMSASSSAAMSSNSSTSCSSTSTMQNNSNCSTGMMTQQDNSVVGMANQPTGVNNQDGKPANYEHSKRAHMMMMTTSAPGSDDLKSGQMNSAAVFNNPAGTQQQKLQQPHMMMQSQLGPGRTSGGRPLSNTGNPSMNMMDVHFGGAGPYHHPSGGSFIGGSGFSQSLGSVPMGGGYNVDKTTSIGGRELMNTSQSAAGTMCDISSASTTGLSQVTYQSPMIQ